MLLSSRYPMNMLLMNLPPLIKSENQLSATKSYAAKHPIMRSARLVGDCSQLGSIPFGDEYVRMANDCDYILKDDNGRPIARIMD